MDPASDDLTVGSDRRETAFRLLFVILFAFVYAVAEIVLVAVVVLQFGFKFIVGSCNDALLQFSASLNRFILHILEYATFRVDEKPFPFTDWPSPDVSDEPSSADSPSG